MFSCVVAGRLPLPPPQQIDATHAVFQLESAEQINHLVVFMTGEQAFPEGYAATVHMMWPQPTGAEPKWQLLGWFVAAHLHISIQNTKPSAIFRVRDPKRDSSMGPVTATLGISVETMEQVEQEMQTLGDSKSASNSMVLAKNGPVSPLDEAAQLAAPIGKWLTDAAQNIFNYLSSFAPESAPQAVPLLQRWLDQFQRKLQTQGISFLMKTENEH